MPSLSANLLEIINLLALKSSKVAEPVSSLLLNAVLISAVEILKLPNEFLINELYSSLNPSLLVSVVLKFSVKFSEYALPPDNQFLNL